MKNIIVVFKCKKKSEANSYKRIFLLRSYLNVFTVYLIWVGGRKAEVPSLANFDRSERGGGGNPSLA